MVTSFLPIGAGLGSSASFSVILSLALLLWNGTLNEEEMSQEKSKGKYLDVINSWAYRAEKLIHGNPSGIDNCVSTYGRFLSFLIFFFFLFDVNFFFFLYSQVEQLLMLVEKCNP